MKAPVLSTTQAKRAISVAPERKSPASENYFPPLSGRFPSKLASIEQVPEPLRSAVVGRTGRDNLRLIVFGPAGKRLGTRTPATLLVVQDEDWLLAKDAEDGSVNVTRCDFANTLLVELTSILLHGQLKIDFAADGRAQFVTAEFNTVMEEYYREATQMLLDGADDVPTPPGGAGNGSALFETLPMKLHNALLQYRPLGQRLLELVRWPATFAGKYRWLQHEIASEAMLALTDRELLFISEEHASEGSRSKQQTKYGKIVTYCPLSRLTDVRLNEYELLDTLDVELRVAQGSEKLKISFPREKKDDVASLVTHSEKQRGLLHA